MIFQKYDYLIYSPHKTATQSVKYSLINAGYNTTHIHSIQNINISKPTLKDFIELTKTKIIYILRNPLDRLKSSYFQSYHDDLVHFLNYEPQDTLISSNSINFLFSDFLFKVNNNKLPGKVDSLLELEGILQYDIFNSLIKKETYFYLFSERINIYVLDFNLIIKEKEKYLSHCLNINVEKLSNNNLTSEKTYSDKYEEFKNLKIPYHSQKIINHQYEKINMLIKRLT